eukprot:945597-Amorphochlora_amoeboformis.AAC.2
MRQRGVVRLLSLVLALMLSALSLFEALPLTQNYDVPFLSLRASKNGQPNQKSIIGNIRNRVMGLFRSSSKAPDELNEGKRSGRKRSSRSRDSHGSR